MNLDPITKMNIIKYIKSYPITEYYYEELTDIIRRKKYKDEDLQNYLMDKIIKDIEDQTTNVNLLNKLIQAIIISSSKGYNEYINLNEELLKKADQVIELYKERIIDKHKLTTEETKQINYFEELINKHYPNRESSNKQSTEEIQKLDSRIEELNKNIENYENKIKELERIIEDQKKSLKKILKENGNLENAKAQQKQAISTSKEEITKFKKEIEILNEKLDTKEQEEKDLKEIIEDLNRIISRLDEDKEKYKKEIEKLEKIHKIQNQELKNYNQQEQLIEEEKTYLKLIEERNKLIENTLIESLYTKNVSIEELINILKQKNINLTHQEIHKHLTSLKTRINISGPIFTSIPPIYKINRHPANTSEAFFINDYNQKSYIDIIAVADFHKNISNNIQNELDKLYNYAASQNITKILNLGDIFRINPPIYPLNLESLNELEKLVESMSLIIPENTGIYQMFLGGNHDKSFLKFGIDPLQKLSEYRSDFVNLGYSHKYLVFGEEKNDNNTLMLHHPDKKINCTSLEESPNQIIYQYLSSYYREKGISLDATYCNIIGHNHFSKIDILNSYCLVPSYTKDREENGAWHIRIYFDSKKEIEHITFIPLVIKDKLTRVTEIEYQKIRKKNLKKDNN